MRRRIVRLRKQSGLSGDHVQDMVAAITGIRRGTINGYCTGRLPLGAKNGPKIAAALGMDWGALLQEIEDGDGGGADREQTRRVLTRLERLVPDDPFLRAAVEALQLQARRLDALENRGAPQVRPAGRR